jgi:hypothetical protein
MQAYKIETTITDDGKIILPPDLKDIFNHNVEIVVLDKDQQKKKNLKFGVYNLGGILDNVNIGDFAHED